MSFTLEIFSMNANIAFIGFMLSKHFLPITTQYRALFHENECNIVPRLDQHILASRVTTHTHTQTQK